MQKLIDKLVLFGICLLVLSFTDIGLISVIAMLCAVAVSALNGYFDKKLPIFLCAIYVCICLILPEFVIFLPLIVYDCAGFTKISLRFYWVAAIPAAIILGFPQIPAGLILTSCAAFLLQYRTASKLKAIEDYLGLVDSAKERADSLELKNRELLEKQDYEVRLATLAERNRIAREIHDNVGHLLTRSLLQVKALSVVNVDDTELRGELDSINTTLSDAMDNVRSSVHALHEDSVDLKSRLETMTRGFTFCPIKLRYDAGELSIEVKLCFTAIVSEALSNIARHSNATEGSISIVEHPAFYQLLITDNGRGQISGISMQGSEQGSKTGIGLQNMTDRVEALGGIFRIEKEKGFKIFISIPKTSASHFK